MTIKKLVNGEESLLLKFLNSHVETSMFMLSNLAKAGLDYHGKLYQGEYLASFNDSQQINGVIAHYWNGNILIQSPSLVILKELLSAFLNYRPRQIAGILGPAEQVEIVIKELKLSEDLFSKNCIEDLYALNLDLLTIPTNLKSQSFRLLPAKSISPELLFAWFKAYAIEALGFTEGQDLTEHVSNRVAQTLNENFRWVLEVDGQAVSLAGINANLADIIQIGPVWTPPEYRNKGYARNLVAMILKQSKEEGITKAILFTSNLAAAKAYQAIGFQKNDRYTVALLKSNNS